MIVKSIIIPIPKDGRKSLSDSKNYRAISLFSSVIKLFQIVIGAKFHDYLITSDLQHGFKPGLSTATCSLTLQEVISHYLQNNSNVYSVFLDATKAFDKVHHVISLPNCYSVDFHLLSYVNSIICTDLSMLV